MTAIRVCLFVVAAVILAAATGAPAQAHGVGWARENVEGAIGLRFAYTDGETMAFAKVSVIGPDGRVFQQARADREGRFVFLPTKTGDWQVSVDDGTGHVLTAWVAFGGGGPAPVKRGIVTRAFAKVSSPVGVILSLSLIANLFCGLALWQRPRKPEFPDSKGA